MGCKQFMDISNPVIVAKRPLFRALEKVILASGSPRRRDFFLDLGFDFEIKTEAIDETPVHGEFSEIFALRMAKEKANAIACHHPDAWVIGADTVVTIDGSILGKPSNEEKALDMLLQLNGSQHRVITAYALVCTNKDMELTRHISTEVEFNSFSEKILKGYVDTGDPMDKAGSYGIQGQGSFLVRKINGSCTNVIGLPISELVEDLLQHQIIESA